MGFIARLDAGKQRFQAAVASQSSAALTPMSTELIRWLSNPSASGKAVNEQTVMGISAAWACRRILAESIGMLPWSMFVKDDNGNAEKADDHPLQDILVYSPNRDQTSVEYRECLGMGLTGDGNSYSLVETLGKRISSLMPITTRVEPMRKAGSNTKLTLMDGAVFFRVDDRGQPVDYPREKIWQVKGFGRDPLKGLSPIMAAREAMGGALAQEEFANRFFSQGGMPSGTITYPGWLKQEQRESARDNLRRLMSGLGNAHSFALFEGGVKPEPWGAANLEEMQFIFARRFSVLEVCRFYRVPPHMVAELEKGASYASIEQMSQEFVMFTLMPYLTRIEASVSKWLLPANERRKFMLRFNYEGLLRADSKGRSEIMAAMLQNGAMHRNEWRAKENLNRVEAPGMDDFTVQSNLVKVEDLGKLALPKPAAAPANAAADRAPALGPINLNLQLPERMEHEMRGQGFPEIAEAVRESQRASVEALSSLREVASGIGKLAKVIVEGNERLVRELVSENAGVAERISEAVDGMGKAVQKASGPRKLIFNEAGDPVGTEPA